MFYIPSENIRFATFNASLNRNSEAQLITNGSLMHQIHQGALVPTVYLSCWLWIIKAHSALNSKFLE